jgi:drug/metabolite transporter superfamily protein YnfA
MAEGNKIKRIATTLLFFFIAGLCEIAGGYLVWL